MTGLLKADLHIHTEYSMDCETPLDKIIERCQETDISCIAIADHDSIEGALIIQNKATFTVIAAEEILTPHGEIMGMFLKERIPSRQSVQEVISQIKAQDGLVCIPHPFDPFRGLKMDIKEIEELAEQIDLIEIFNSRSPLNNFSKKAKTFADKFGIPGTVGSDAHTVSEIGNTYIEIREFNGKDDFLEALSEGRVHQHRSSPFVHFNSTWAKIKNIF